MNIIHSLSSDLDLELEFLRNLKQRDIEQKFLYLNNNAKSYYDTSSRLYDADTKRNILKSQVDFITKFLKKGSKVAIASLGCGNLSSEIEIVIELQKSFEVTLYGVDSSRTMLELAGNELKKYDISYHLICADFTSRVFRTEMDTLLDHYDQRIYSFLGGTIGNVTQSDIVDTLYNILQKDDIIWLDAATRASKSKTDDLKLFNNYVRRLEEKNEMHFCFYPLESIGVPVKNGKMVMETTYEEAVGVIVFRYGFEFEIPTTISYRDETIHFLPPEVVNLLEIRLYHAETMVRYFEAHGFLSAGTETLGNGAQFAFKKQ